MVAPTQQTLMSRQEIHEVCREWQEHFALLEGKVNASDLEVAKAWLHPSNFDGEPFHLSPAKEQVDAIPYWLYGMLTCAPAGANKDALLICRLTAGELQASFDEHDPGRIDMFDDEDEFDIRMLSLQFGLAEFGIPVHR